MLPRLAFIDGLRDPWLSASERISPLRFGRSKIPLFSETVAPHSWHANPRDDTIRMPFKIIHRGIHHWDENSVTKGSEPADIRVVHDEEIRFVRAWLSEPGVLV